MSERGMTEKTLRRIMAIRGYLDAEGRRSTREIRDRLDLSDSMLYPTLARAMEIGAIVEIAERGEKGLIYYQSAEGLPEGWSERDPADALALHRAPVIRTRAKRKQGTITGIGECAMAKALTVTRPVDASTVWQYRTLYDLIGQMPEAGPDGWGQTGEMQDILRELKEFLNYRMRNVKAECPFCRGEVVNDGGAYCTKCKRRVSLGVSFEDNLTAMKMLASAEEDQRDRYRWPLTGAETH